MMQWQAAAASLAFILITLQDIFESRLLPRRVKRLYRFSRRFFHHAWKPWTTIVRQIRSEKRRVGCLSYFGPLSILVLFMLWAV